MKKLFKLCLMILLSALSVTSCKGHKSAGNSDSATTGFASANDTIKHADTTVKVDTLKPATDTSDMKTDTVSKTIHSKMETRKINVKRPKSNK